MIDKADTIFILVCAVAMLLMIPALEKVCEKRRSGRVWVSFGAVIVIWAFWGFSFAYGKDHIGLIGGGEYLFLNYVSCSPIASFGETIPPLAFFMLQAVVSCITVVLASSAVSTRLNQKAYFLIVILWSILVYIPFVHMIWGGGLLSQIGFLDYG